MAKLLVASCLFLAFLAFKIFAPNHPPEAEVPAIADPDGVPFHDFLYNGYEGPSGDNNTLRILIVV